MKTLTAFPIAVLIVLIMALSAALSSAGIAVIGACRAIDRRVDNLFNRDFDGW